MPLDDNQDSETITDSYGTHEHRNEPRMSVSELFMQSREERNSETETVACWYGHQRKRKDTYYDIAEGQMVTF